MDRRAQQTGSQAAMVVGIITLLIIFYILFLPPEERDAILGDTTPGMSGSSSTGGSSGQQPSYIGDVIFRENIGRIDYQSLDSYEYDLSAINIYETQDTEVLGTQSNFMLRNGWFENKESRMEFYVEDPGQITNTMLSVTLKDVGRGSFIMTLNGEEIYNYNPSQPNLDPIEINPDMLNRGTNVVRFMVSGVGVSFWTTNQVQVESAKVVATISDTSRSESMTSFYITSDESSDIEKAVIKFFPDCRTSDAGLLTVDLNHISIFKGVPDCGILNTQAISPSRLNVGKNTLQFRTDKGSYLIDQITVKTFLEEPMQPTYYFDLDDELFKDTYEELTRCGDIDGVCPEDCNEDLDKDCCFDEYVDGYWCDIKTDYLDDRCVGHVDSGRCGVCRSGYEDESGNPPEDCEELCGDDDDGECPDGCGINLDKDCCFDRPGDQFWCEDLPTTGEDYICMDSLTYDSCKYCPTDYDGEDSNVKCERDKDTDDREELREGMHIILEFKFTERGDSKEAEFYINGYENGFDTREDSYRTRIDDDVEPGTNSIRLVPKSDLDIRELLIKVED